MTSQAWTVEHKEEFERALGAVRLNARKLYDLCLEPDAKSVEAKIEMANGMLRELVAFTKARDILIRNPEKILRLPKVKDFQRRVITDVFLFKHAGLSAYYIVDREPLLITGLFAFPSSQSREALRTLILYLENYSTQ